MEAEVVRSSGQYFLRMHVARSTLSALSWNVTIMRQTQLVNGQAVGLHDDCMMTASKLMVLCAAVLRHVDS